MQKILIKILIIMKNLMMSAKQVGLPLDSMPVEQIQSLIINVIKAQLGEVMYLPRGWKIQA